jgi:uncharacterized protein (DUF3084 family)
VQREIAIQESAILQEKQKLEHQNPPEVNSTQIQDLNHKLKLVAKDYNELEAQLKSVNK